MGLTLSYSHPIRLPKANFKEEWGPMAQHLTVDDNISLSSSLGDSLTEKRYIPSKRAYLLGCPIEPLTLDQTVAEVHKIIATRQPHQHCVLNAGKFVLMNREPTLKKIVHSCDFINADGQSVVWAAKLLGQPIPERVTGIDLMDRLFIEADKKNYRVYFLGAENTVLLKVLNYIRKNFPGIDIAGFHHGYFGESNALQVVDSIRQSHADILLVAMGSPKKEYWISQYLTKLSVPFCMGVGGSFDVIAGKAKRAPRWIQNIGMEWFYRFIQEPRRLWRRYLVDNFIFIYLVASALFKNSPRLKRLRKQDLVKKEIT